MLPTNRFFMVPSPDSYVLVAMPGAVLKRSFEKNAKPVRARGMAQFTQRFGLDLTNALASYGENLADFLQGVLAAVIEAEAHLDDAFFARGERTQHSGHLFFQVEIDGGVGRRDHAFIFDQVAEMSFLVFANGGLERDRLLSNFFGFAHRVDGNIHARGDFFGSGFAAEFLHELLAGANLFVDGLDHVHRNANGAGLIGDGASDGLTNPPSGVSGEFIAAAPFEFVGALHEADVAFLDEVEELQAAIAVFFGDGDDETKIGFGQFLFCLVGFGFAAVNQNEGALESRGPGLRQVFDLLALETAQAQLFARSGSIAASGGGAAFEAVDFALQSVHALGGVAEQIDEALFLAFLEIQGAGKLGHFDPGAGQAASGSQISALVGLGDVLELRGLAVRQVE